MPMTLAQKDLHTTANRLRNIVVDLGAAHVSATRAADNGGPDFRNRVKTLIDGAEALLNSIEDAAGPIEPHPHAPCTEPLCPIHGERVTNLHGRAGFGG